MNIIYPKDHAKWTAVELTATATVNGTQSSTSASFWLVGLATDYNNQTVAPPGENSPADRRRPAPIRTEVRSLKETTRPPSGGRVIFGTRRGLRILQNPADVGKRNVFLIGPMGSGKSAVGSISPACWKPPSTTATLRSSAARASISPLSSRRRAKRGFGIASAR